MVDETQKTTTLQPTGSPTTSSTSSLQQGQGSLQPQSNNPLQQTSPQTPASLNQIDRSVSVIALNSIPVTGSTVATPAPTPHKQFPTLYASVMVLSLAAFAYLAYGLLRQRP